MKEPAASAQSTEERIRQAARRLFLEKGYDGTTSRDLAEASGLNVSMTNYYFRSKEKLFQLTFQDLHRIQFAKLNSLVNQDLPLREKILQLIEAEYELVVENPDLPLFIMHEMRRHPDLFVEQTPVSSPYPSLQESVFARQVAEAVASKEIKPVSALQIIMMIVSNVHYPFVGKAAITHALRMTNAELMDVVSQHQQVVKDMIIGYLFGAEQKI
ncbi:TetR/AcrR family transcriptional regulator [Hymenobacter sp. YC55]|uniref:TetR/AcrR family transcriptional regulator n=1 Tax=Hymenobacter sp. YC55 TaxID=3034019 RepID=UPI0023F9C5ED|nr:TetR/AcrR family transcriptional regulator [Hymenobacter sp. YC55]MDF7811562.1 TetR/AcrR family transcriptional regulator [Hymenobacter sp. YC55]